MKIKGFQDTINWHNKNADKYAKSVQNIPSIGLDDFLKEVPRDSIILDVGCGAGRDTKRILDRGFPVKGIDISTQLIKMARKNYPLHFETVSEVLSALKEFRRILIKGGVLHVLVQEKTTEKKFDVISDKLSGHNRFFQYFTRDEIENYFKKMGFTIVKIE